MISRTGKNRLNRLNKPYKVIISAGFTLIELVLVALIILVIIGLSTPLFRRQFSGLEMKNASFNIAKAVNYAQEMAIIDRTVYKVNFDFEKGVFWITKRMVSEDVETYTEISGRYGRIFYMPKGAALTGKTAEIMLYPDGRSDAGVIQISDKNGDGYEVSIGGFETRIEEMGAEDVKAK